MPRSVAAEPVRIQSRYRMYRGKEIVLGPGKAEILRHIGETGSISEAARLMDMSYNRAWLHVKTLNGSFAEPLVESVRGGNAGGGAALTEMGRKVLALYVEMEAGAESATKAVRRKLTALVKD